MPEGNAAPSAALGAEDTSDFLRAPPGRTSLPAYEQGWRSEDGSVEPFLSYVNADPSVNWSDELEQLQVIAGLDRDLHVVVGRGLGLLHARLEAVDALRGLRIRCDAGDEGTASGIDDEGRLLVRRADGVLARWSAGEVHLVA